MAAKVKVIIAEDFQLLLEDMIEIVNRQLDMEVVGFAKTGKEIVELAENVEFDIVLMDIEMENINAGIDATRLIRDGKPDAKVIFLTAHERQDIIITAMATGAIDYIIKGSSEAEVLEHIRRAYAGEPIMEGRIHGIIMKEYKRLQQSEKSLLFFIQNVSNLTTTEKEIVKLLMQDKKVREIAEERSVEMVTVKTQISGILKKFGEKRTKAIIKKIKDLNISHLF